MIMKQKSILILAVSVFALWFLIGCKKASPPITNTSPPVVTIQFEVKTDSVTNLSSTSVASGGIITTATNIIDKGIIWGIDSSVLTISSVNKISNGSGQSNFIDTIQNLQPNTNYYLRAYAVNSLGTTYGAIIKFVTSPVVYIAGMDGVSATYWRNGTNILLPINNVSTISSWAHSIFVAGNNIYVAGEAQCTTAPIFAVTWRNGNAIPLTNTIKSSTFSTYTCAVAHSNFVVGNDEYVAGYELYTGPETSPSGNPVARYWKNGKPVSLTNGTNENTGIIYSIYVVGSDVYAVGYTGNLYKSSSTATFWKNGLQIPLTDSSKTTASAKSIFVKGSDVYIAGYETMGVGVGSFSFNKVAKYWKNGQPVALTDGTRPAYANSIYCNESDIYVAGWEEDNTTGLAIAKYWKNGISVSLAKSETSLHYQATSISVNGNNIYVVGFAIDKFTNIAKPKYWINGIEVTLPHNNKDARASSVFVN